MVNDDRADEMVAPEEEEHDAAGESTDADDKTPMAAAQDDRLSPTSLYCSLPLNRDVQSIIDIFPKTDSERKKTRKLPCLYCERTFVADGLRQKHVERCHSMKQARRSSSRFQQAAGSAPGSAGPTGGIVPAPLQCMFCNAFQSPDGDLGDLFTHLMSEHTDRYHACELCKERFVLKTHLEEHRDEIHGIKRERDLDMESVINAHVIEHVFKNSKPMGMIKDIKDLQELKESRDFKDSKNYKESRDDDLVESIFLEPKDLRSTTKRIALKSTKLGIKRSARLQNKEFPSQNKSTSVSSQLKKKLSKSKPPEVDLPVERETIKVPVHENPYPTFDAFYRVKKITDHSIDNLRITSLTFNDVFDQAFYTRIKCNIADNLMNHIDGKLFKNEESESRISNFEKAQVEMTLQGENNYGCEISLNAATPVASFLAPQLGDDPEAQIEYGSKASKKKTKPDEVHYKYFTRRKYQASIQEIKENRDLSKLDMWTQYGVKNRQQAIANKNKSEKEKQDYKKGEEYRAKRQNEELNRILDRRGPFEDLKLEANKRAVLEGNSCREARVEVSSVLEDILHKVFDMSMVQSEVLNKGIKTELTDAEIPGYLNLRRASPTGETYVDRSDKITLICASEETENFEAPQVSPRDKHSLVELSGEWTRSRLFICAACGMKLGNMKSLIDHKNNFHQNVWCHHYEFVGKQGAYYKHLSIPGLGKMQQLEAHPACKAWVRSNARQCTKCNRISNTLGELHRHILECGEDWSWMLIRKKCKYRPFGAKTRRKRRGLFKRQITNKDKTHGEERKEKKTYKKEGPRVKPSDAETIQRMLANLPAKRATRKEMSLKDGFPKLIAKKIDKKDSKFSSTKSRSEQLIKESTLVTRKVLVANKCNPEGNLRKSVRNVNKVISSALLDNSIRMRRKFKAAKQTRVLPSRDKELILMEAPVELTEEQRAEEVKKKISLFKKVQNLRRSVIKKRTTKVSTSSADIEAEPSTSGTNKEDTSESVRKTRSAASVRTDIVESPPKKKLRSNFGARLMHTLTLRRRNKDRSNQHTKEGESAIPAPKRKLNLANIKKAVKKLKMSNKKGDSDIKLVQVVEPTKLVNGADVGVDNAPSLPPLPPPVDGHFLEESIRANAIRTISEQSDNDNRPSAIAPPSDNTNIDNDNSVTVTVHQKANCDKDNNETNDLAVNLTNDSKGPTAIVTPFNKIKDQIAQKPVVDELLQSSSPCVPLNLVLNNKTNHNTNVSDGIIAPIVAPSIVAAPNFSTKVDNYDETQVVNNQHDPPQVDVGQKVDIIQKPKTKLCKRAKGLNDCIAMLTSKLKCKSDPEPPLTLISSFNDPTQQVQQQLETAVVVVTPHDTTTEEQNVVIPEETDSVNLESAKEPEVAPPSPKIELKLETMQQTPMDDTQTATAITISDLSRPVIEQDKENIELEQKALLSQNKQGYDISFEKVVDIFKCFDDIKSNEIRNGHMDSISMLNHAKAEVINGLAKCTKQGRKIGASRKPTNKRAETKLVQESLTLARIEEELCTNGLARKIGSKRSPPERKINKANAYKNPIQDYNWEMCGAKANTIEKDIEFIVGAMHDDVVSKHKANVKHKNETNTNFILQIPKFNLSAIMEETVVHDISISERKIAEKITTDESQVIDHPNNAPQPPMIVQTSEDIPPLTEKTDTVKVDADIKAAEHLQPQNEAEVLENKAIPHSDLLSESEDELPLAALLKTIAPLYLEDNCTTGEDILQKYNKAVTSECVQHVTPEGVEHLTPESVDTGIRESEDMGNSPKNVPVIQELQLEGANNYQKKTPVVKDLELEVIKISSKKKTIPKKAKAPAKNNKRLGKMEVKRLHAYFNPILIPVDKSQELEPDNITETVTVKCAENDFRDLKKAINDQIDVPEITNTSTDLSKLIASTQHGGKQVKDITQTIISEERKSPQLFVDNATPNELNTTLASEGDKSPNILPEVEKLLETVKTMISFEIEIKDHTETVYTVKPSELVLTPSEIEIPAKTITGIEEPQSVTLDAVSQFIDMTSKSKKTKKSRKSAKNRRSTDTVVTSENLDDVISVELTQKWNEQLRALTRNRKSSAENKPITELITVENDIPIINISPSEDVKSKRTSQRMQKITTVCVTPKAQPMIEEEISISQIVSSNLETSFRNQGICQVIPIINIVPTDFDRCLKKQTIQKIITLSDSTSEAKPLTEEEITTFKIESHVMEETPLQSRKMQKPTVLSESTSAQPLIEDKIVVTPDLEKALRSENPLIASDIPSIEQNSPTTVKAVLAEDHELNVVFEQISNVNIMPQLEFENVICRESPESEHKVDGPISEVIPESSENDKHSNRRNAAIPINLSENKVDDILEEDMPLKSLIKVVDTTTKVAKSKKNKKQKTILTSESLNSVTDNILLEKADETIQPAVLIDKNIVTIDSILVEPAQNTPKSKRSKKTKPLSDASFRDLEISVDIEIPAISSRPKRNKKEKEMLKTPITEIVDKETTLHLSSNLNHESEPKIIEELSEELTVWPERSGISEEMVTSKIRKSTRSRKGKDNSVQKLTKVHSENGEGNNQEVSVPSAIGLEATNKTTDFQEVADNLEQGKVVEVPLETIAIEVSAPIIETPEPRLRRTRKQKKLPFGSKSTDNEDSPIAIETTPEPTRSKRGRKRKSHETLIGSLTQPEETLPEIPSKSRIISSLLITEIESRKHLPLSIYDFDEDDDECTGDNSKENMKQVKAKSPNRHKRASSTKPIKDNKISDVWKEAVSEELCTPLKDVQNESFIQTPDMNDSGLANKLAVRFKIKKGKSRSKKQTVSEESLAEHYCDICNKQFGRMDSLNKHKRTLTHIAKLSEIEALEAEAKKKQRELEDLQQGKVDSQQIVPEEELSRATYIINEIVEQPKEVKFATKAADSLVKESDIEPEIYDSLNLDSGDEDNVRSLSSPFIPAKTQNSPTIPSDVTKSVLVTSPFSIKTNNDSLRLADIISDVLNKPVETMESYDMDKSEPKRYKSLGERKSFDSDSVVYNPTSSFTNISPASTLINKGTSNEFLKNQLSLLENIIEENKASFEYMDDASVQSIDSTKSSRCLSDMSLVSDIQPNNSSRIISYTQNKHLHDEENFVKPSHQTQYEEISEDSMNNRNYEQERSRKTLNRDEELFLECCSLLKSSSEVSNYSKKSSRAPPTGMSDGSLKKGDTTDGWPLKQHETRNNILTENDDFMSDSCPNTPIGDTYDDFSNSDTIKTDWSTKINKKSGYEDISQSSMDKCNGEENTFKAFNFKALDSKSEVDESSDSTDFRKNINAKFVGLMAEALKGKSPKRKKPKERESKSKSADFTQTSITDFAVQLTPKSCVDSTDNFLDLTNDSKKMLTKGAMKVFEGLKVSIPTDDLDMNQVFNCSPKAKRLEIEESTKINGKSKAINTFGNKLGLKVTKRRTPKEKKKSCDHFIGDTDKVLDVYDFEETQDNTDLFCPTSKMVFRNGKKNSEKIEQPGKKTKIVLDLVESESESNNQDLDLFGAEVQSVNSFSTETESSTSIKPINAVTSNENITKKKCVIMGRIFKNAFKAKMDGTKESTPVDETDPLDRFIIGGPLEEVATPPPVKSPISTERPKMTEKEMDLLFDRLLQTDQPKVEGKIGSSSNNCTPLVSPIAKNEEQKENKDQKDSKSKKHTPKTVKSNRRRSRKHSESSDDEFNLSKSPKKRQPRKNHKEKDNGINLEQELKECMGVAGRKSQRKCTSGKQNVLIEYWSSDDSEFEAMLRLSMQETAHTNKEKQILIDDVNGDEEGDLHNDKEEIESNKDDNDEELVQFEPSLLPVTHFEEDDNTISNTDDVIDPKAVTKPTKTKRSNSNAKVRDGSKSENKSQKTVKSAKHVRLSKFSQDEATLAANRRKRAAVDTLYYWSSSSDDDTQNLIEVKSLRDEIDDEEDRPQHGWIVGDSPKKLVTLLAHAKGKKTSNR